MPLKDDNLPQRRWCACLALPPRAAQCGWPRGCVFHNHSWQKPAKALPPVLQTRPCRRLAAEGSTPVFKVSKCRQSAPSGDCTQANTKDSFADLTRASLLGSTTSVLLAALAGCQLRKAMCWGTRCVHGDQAMPCILHNPLCVAAVCSRPTWL
jgi:hypothetical protein